MSHAAIERYGCASTQNKRGSMVDVFSDTYLMDAVGKHVRERFDLPENWIVKYYRIEGSPPTYRIEGAQYSRYARGPKSGQINWNKRLSPRQVLFIPCSEHDRWKQNWARKNERCAECLGRGSTWHKWTRQAGAETKPCRTCRGTGEIK